VEAVGKNLVLRFEGGLVLRSHLRMTGRWRVERRGTSRSGRPWLVLRGDEHEAVPERAGARARPRRRTACAPRPGHRLAARPRRDARAAAGSRPRGRGCAADQRLVSGIGNIWKAESPGRRASRHGDRSPTSRRRAARCPRRRQPADAGLGRGRSAAAARLPARRPRLPSLRHRDPPAPAGRGGKNRVLVPGLPAGGSEPPR
jgi:hypothetical protein